MAWRRDNFPTQTAAIRIWSIHATMDQILVGSHASGNRKDKVADKAWEGQSESFPTKAQGPNNLMSDIGTVSPAG